MVNSYQAKRYHVLYVQWEKGDSWTPEFGDWDRDIVVHEFWDSYNGDCDAWTIEPLLPSPMEVDEITAKAGQEATDRLNRGRVSNE